MVNIKAEVMSFIDDGECSVLSFADDPKDPVNYVILQIADQPDDEEIASGWEGVHIDTGALGIEGYDLAQDINETETGVTIRLASDSLDQTNIDQDIEIELTRDALDRMTLSKAIRILKGRLSFKA